MNEGAPNGKMAIFGIRIGCEMKKYYNHVSIYLDTTYTVTVGQNINMW